VKGHPAADYGWKGIAAQNDVMTLPRQLHGDGRGDLVGPKYYREGARVAIE
jgi:hypothetical protein